MAKTLIQLMVSLITDLLSGKRFKVQLHDMTVIRS
jgi:hypothetical protein